MVRWAVDLLLWQMDSAFSGSEESSLVANLRSVSAEDWLWVPEGGTRTIRDMARHIGACKVMYQDHAFGSASLWWDQAVVLGSGRLGSVESAIDWLSETHGVLRASVAELSDDDLLVPRKANWGELKETRWLINVLITHDAYHAGEINHLRAIRRGADAWEYPPPTED